jgi:hypothetical protein
MHIAAERHALRLLIAVTWISGAVLAPRAAAEAPDSSADPAALLTRFAGDWKTHTHITHAGPPPREFDTRGTANCHQTLGGRYFEFRSESIPPGESDLQIMTYDEDAKLFRQWVFSSDGYTHTATGTWDAATSTLRWTGKTADSTFLILDRWTSPDRLDWTLERKNAAGKTLQTIEGTLERVK